MDASSMPAGSGGPSTAGAIIDGREAFTAALRDAMTALPPAVRELWLVDTQFEGWPLDEPVVLESLGAWLRRGARTLHIVGADFQAVARQFPRFAGWRHDYAHALHAWQPLEDERVDLAAMWVCSAGAIEMIDREQWRARILNDASAVRPLVERIGALLHRCQSAWPATTLGL